MTPAPSPASSRARARPSRGFLPAARQENGYQEAFSSPFKVELGAPSRFQTLGELVAEGHRLVYAYNHTRIHSALTMPPGTFREKNVHRVVGVRVVEQVS